MFDSLRALLVAFVYLHSRRSRTGEQEHVAHVVRSIKKNAIIILINIIIIILFILCTLSLLVQVMTDEANSFKLSINLYRKQI